jgi:hypothetical protein
MARVEGIWVQRPEARDLPLVSAAGMRRRCGGLTPAMERAEEGSVRWPKCAGKRSGSTPTMNGVEEASVPIATKKGRGR